MAVAAKVSAHWILTGAGPIEAPGAEERDRYKAGLDAGWAAAIEWVTRQAADAGAKVSDVLAAQDAAQTKAGEKPKSKRGS